VGTHSVQYGLRQLDKTKLPSHFKGKVAIFIDNDVVGSQRGVGETGGKSPNPSADGTGESISDDKSSSICDLLKGDEEALEGAVEGIGEAGD
jgi:hypothetical protein